MADINREKYLQLMVQIEELEDKITDLEKIPAIESSPTEIKELKEKYAEKRNELARISKGCGGHII